MRILLYSFEMAATLQQGLEQIDVAHHAQSWVEDREDAFLDVAEYVGIRVAVNYVRLPGPEAWLDKWNVDETEEDMNKQQEQLRNNETDENKFRAEEAAKKHSVSKGWSSNFMMAMYSTSNAVIFHIDSLYRYMDRCDATANRGKCPPLLLQLASPLATRNPIKVFYCKVGEMFSPQSDVNWMILRWFSAVQVPYFAFKIAFRIVRMILRVQGRMLLKIGLEIDTQMRFRIWAVISAQYFDGLTSYPALKQAESLEQFTSCCEDDPFS